MPRSCACHRPGCPARARPEGVCSDEARVSSAGRSQRQPRWSCSRRNGACGESGHEGQGNGRRPDGQARARYAASPSLQKAGQQAGQAASQLTGKLREASGKASSGQTAAKLREMSGKATSGQTAAKLRDDVRQGQLLRAGGQGPRRVRQGRRSGKGRAGAPGPTTGDGAVSWPAGSRQRGCQPPAVPAPPTCSTTWRRSSVTASGRARTARTWSSATASSRETWRQDYPYEERLGPQAVREGEARPADRAAQAPAAHQGHRRPAGHRLRGPRRGRQGRHDQALHREPEPARRPDRGPGEADRPRADRVVPAALHRAPARCRRDRHVRPVLVQPGRASSG